VRRPTLFLVAAILTALGIAGMTTPGRLEASTPKWACWVGGEGACDGLDYDEWIATCMDACGCASPRIYCGDEDELECGCQAT
jgi:hypothetical protein